MPIRCDNPRCPDCYPQPAVTNSVNLASIASRPWGPVTINFEASSKEFAEAILNQYRVSSFDLGLPTKNKEQPMTSSAAQRLIEDLRQLEDKDFPAISKEIDNIKARRKDSLEENLDGVARMALMDQSTRELHCFALSYFKDGKVNTVQGVELGMSSTVPESEEGKEHRVYVFGRDYPVTGTHYTMNRLEKTLEDSNIPYAFVYRSK